MAAGSSGEIKPEVSQCLFEFLHMQVVAYFQNACGKERNGEVISQLEQLGYRVGESLVERVCKDNPRFRTELDAMVFLAKQFWVTLFNKQADHLKTNKQDMFVLYDNKFRMLVHMSDSAQYKDSAPLYLAFSTGVISGAMHNLGISCQVSAEIPAMPQCIFNIKITI